MDEDQRVIRGEAAITELPMIINVSLRTVQLSYTLPQRPHDYNYENDSMTFEFRKEHVTTTSAKFRLCRVAIFNTNASILSVTPFTQ